MPKPYTFPTLFDEVLQIHLSKLIQWDYLNPNQIKSGTLSWSRNGNKTGSISITVNTQSECPSLTLNYKYNDEPRNYNLDLVSIPSNLGKGSIWYFVCPRTYKRCRKLYCIDGYFLHREAFNYCMYESQTKSNYGRKLDNILGMYFKTDQIYEQLYSKHFKKFYAGKATKKYVRLMEQLQQIERIPYHEIERLMIK